MTLFHGSIRKQLVILVLLAATPVLIVLLGTEFVHRRNAVDDAKKEAALFLNGFTEIQQRITDSTQTLLRTVASMPEVRTGEVDKARVILSTLLETNPVYTNAILVDTRGNVLAAGRNQARAEKFNFADRKQFKEALLSRKFAPGEFVVGKSSKKSIFPFAMPVFDPKGAARGVILIGVNLNHYADLFKRGGYAQNTFFGVCDHKGTRLFRYPSSEKTPVGAPIKPEVYKAARTQGGFIMARTSDGLKRIIASEPVRLSKGAPAYMYMFMGYDYRLIQDQANAIVYRAALFGGISLILTLAIAWFVGGTGIARRIGALSALAEKFGRGEEKDISTGIDYDDGEIGTLAESLDKMFSILRRREKERADALDQLSSSERRFRAIIEDVAGISIQGYDEERKVSFWNAASEALYGYTRKEALGQKLEDLIIPGPMKEEVKRRHTRWIEKGEKIPASELILRDNEGNEVPVFSSHVLHQTHLGKEMFCIDIDMKPLKQSEADRKLLLDRLRQSQKMEAIGTLAGGIAHDFNNILFPILGHSEMLLDDLGDQDHPAKESLDQIYASAMRAKELVRQILTFSRQETAEFRPTKVQTILKEVIKLLRSTIPQHIDIRQAVDENAGPVNADPIQIHQILMNLATNAFHAIGDEQGRLTIGLEEQQLNPSTAGRLELQPGQALCLTVSDTGAGMDPGLADKIFDPFFTTKEKGKGTGMGLAVVHGIVKNMGGSIHVDSTLGRGTEFIIYLPMDDGDPGENGKDAHCLSPSFKGKESILLVDDEQVILQLERQILERSGYGVESTPDPVKALEIFGNSPDKFDLVITDMSMPRIQGYKLASELLGIRPDIPIILCTGFNETLSLETAKDLGIKKVLMKPVSLKKLEEAVRTVLDGQA